MRVSPTVSAPKISARCEMDLSPGTRTRPESGRPGWAVSGDGAAAFTLMRSNKGPAVLACVLAARHPSGRKALHKAVWPLLTGPPQLAK